MSKRITATSISSRTEGQQPDYGNGESEWITDPENLDPLFEAFDDPDARRIMEAAE